MTPRRVAGVSLLAMPFVLLFLIAVAAHQVAEFLVALPTAGGMMLGAWAGIRLVEKEEK